MNFEDLGIKEKDIKARFIGYARGDDVKGWPMAFPNWKYAKVFLTEKEIVIISGWTLKAVLRIPVKNIVSVKFSEYCALPPSLSYFPNDRYLIIYKTLNKIKELDLIVSNQVTKSRTDTKAFFEPFLKK